MRIIRPILPENDLLNYATAQGIIDLSYVQEQIDMIKRKELLEMHPYSIWQSKDGNWHTYLPPDKKAGEEGGRIPRRRRTKKEIEDLVVKYWKNQIENPTIKEVFDMWNEERYQKGKIANGTYKRSIECFKRHYGQFGKRRIMNVTQVEFEEFLEDQIAEYDLTAKAFASLKGITKGLITYAKRKNFINYNGEQVMQELLISKKDYKSKKKPKEKEVFSEEELPIVLTYLLKNLDNENLGILLMFLTGIRVGELCVISNHDLEKEYDSIDINKTETRFYNTKSKKYEYRVKFSPKTDAGNRKVYIPSDYHWVMDMLRSLNPEGEYVFVNQKGDRLTAACFRSRMYRICRKLKIVPKSPHKARKTYISILLDNNVDRKLVESVAGHTENSCTETSYHRDRKSERRKVEIISAIPEFRLSNIEN